MASDPVPPTNLDLVLLLSQASHGLNLRLTARLEELGVSVREYCVLSKALGGSFTQTQLAEMSDLDKTTMVVTVDELERTGLAERRPLPEDRRARVVAVTPEGEEVVDRARGIVAGFYEEALAAIPARERKAFVDGLVRLVDSLRAAPVTEAEDRPSVRRQRARKMVRTG